MNAQEIFDKAVGGVIRQGDLSVGGPGRCYYRHPELPLACGIGHLVDDETARKWDDIQSQGGVSSIEILPKDLVPEELHLHMDLMSKIQIIHDDVGVELKDPTARLRSFIRRAGYLATKKGLEMKFSEADIPEVAA